MATLPTGRGLPRPVSDVTVVGHSVSAMIGAIAAIDAPELFRALVMAQMTVDELCVDLQLVVDK